MLMTEEVARDKRCCVAGCGDERPKLNETGQLVGALGNFCVASECMGWRWATKLWLTSAGVWLTSVYPQEQINPQIIERRALQVGFCGRSSFVDGEQA